MDLRTVLIVCGSCCLLLILASCVLLLLGWLVRTIRPRRKVYNTPAPNEAGDIIEGEYKEIGPKKGDG